ncbi:hypothetical protein Bbelb_109670 [Branchiostoma belcheri]|nr:hypothetical protein Bbelb_109670 [Branchiostoma belcheri]
MEGQHVAFKVARIVHISSPQGEGIDELDYSLLELEVPPDQFDKLPPGLGHKIEKAVQRATVRIIGHPGGRPKEADFSCPVVGTNHTIAVYFKFHSGRHADDQMLNNPKRCNYLSSFDGGSSGSPGFDDDQNLVVMHTCGYHLYDTAKVEVAQGVRMTAIRDDLKQHLSADESDIKDLESANPKGRFWIKVDGTDIKPALQESKKGEWNGDPDLKDCRVQNLRKERDDRLKLLDATEGDTLRRLGLQQLDCP